MCLEKVPVLESLWKVLEFFLPRTAATLMKTLMPQPLNNAAKYHGIYPTTQYNELQYDFNVIIVSGIHCGLLFSQSKTFFSFLDSQ